MKILDMVFIFSILLFGGIVSAANSPFAALYQQVSSGRLCGPVVGLSKNERTYLCKERPQNFIDLQFASTKAFEDSVFQEAARAQLAKNKCLEAQIPRLLSKENRKTWISQLASVWLAKRKAELIIERCLKEVEHKLDLKDRLLHGPRGAYDKAMLEEYPLSRGRSGFESNWATLCQDKNTMSAIRLANELFAYSLPVVNSPEFFELLEKNRNIILDTTTGQQISDQKILESDLGHLGFVKIKSNQAFESGLARVVNKLQDERRAANQKVEAALKKQNLDSEIKDYLFNDDTVYQVLDKHGLLDREKNLEQQSSGVFCLISGYEPSFMGEIADLVGMTLLLRTPILKAIKGAEKYVPLEEKLKKAQATKFAFQGAFLNQVGRSVTHSCFSDLPTQEKTISAQAKEEKVKSEAENLPEDFHWSYWSSDIDVNKNPACADAVNMNLAIDTYRKEFGCLTTAILSLTPIQYAIPAIFLSQ